MFQKITLYVEPIMSQNNATREQLLNAIVIVLTVKLLECFLGRIVQYELEVKNAEYPSYVSGIYPALQVICQWLKANTLSVCKDNVVVNHPR